MKMYLAYGPGFSKECDTREEAEAVIKKNGGGDVFVKELVAVAKPVVYIVCPECGGDGADFEDSSKSCFECNGTGRVRDA